jgi:CheY-like chemotaxis protein
MARCACGRRKVLIVDDDDAIRDSLCEVLTDEGCDVTTVASGAAALDHLRREHACLVLLDLMMPGISGWQLMAHVLEDAQLSRIPICIVSAVDTHAPFGAVTVLRKPLDVPRLIAVVEHYCPTTRAPDPSSAAV